MYLSLIALLLPLLLALAPQVGTAFPTDAPAQSALPDSMAACGTPYLAEPSVIAGGVYTCPNDGSTLTVCALGNGTYSAEISLYRLTLQEGVGTYSNDVLTVSATDAAGGIMIWHIKKDGEILRAEVASSTWSLLPEGTVFEFAAE